MTEIEIEGLGHLGDGIAAGPVYVPRTLPGERVRGEVEGDRIAQPKILRPSPDRVTPACPHYASCGGCALLHARDDFVAHWKADRVTAALRAHGLRAEVRAIATSPPNARRRAVLSGRRTKKGATVGFHGRAAHTVTAVTACRVLDPAILDALPILERITRAGVSRSGELRLTVSVSRDGLDVCAENGLELSVALRGTLVENAAQGAIARLTWSGETVFQSAPPGQVVGGVPVVPPPGAFLQATREGEAALVASVLAATAGARRLADLFAGCGTFALPLSRRAAVHAVEADPATLAAAQAGWRAMPGGRAMTVATRDLFRRPLLAEELAAFDAVVLDPPRAGAEAQMAQIARSGVSRVASVSCNPATFARDTAILAAAGFEIADLRVIDQFRWSPHVEIASTLVRDGRHGLGTSRAR